MRPEQQIQHTLLYLRSLEAKADKAARRYLRSLKKQDRFAFSVDTRDLMPTVRDIMSLAFVEGYQNRPTLKLAASPFRRQMRRVDQYLDEEGLGRVVDDFSTRAIEELGRVNRSLQPFVSKLLRADNSRDIGVALNSLIGVAEGRVKTVIRTAAHSALSAAHYLADQRPEVRDQIWGYQYVTQADERVREEHWAMHGVIQPKDHPIWSIWWPPNGWNCRCILVTLYDEYITVEPSEVDGGMPMPDPGFATNPAMLIGV